MTPPPLPPAVSVIVPAYGVAELVGEALTSLQAQGFQDWEAIVVDDGDTARVAAALLPFRDDPRIRLLAIANGGVSHARNAAAAMARAPLLAMLDGDDRYEPDYLETMVAAAADGAAGLVCCDARLFGLPHVEGRLFSDGSPQDGPVTLAAVLDRRFNIFTAALIARAAFEAVGGYDPALRLAEDLDLWIRLLAAGWPARFVDRPLVQYRRRAASLSSATVPMLRATADVLASAAERLRGRPGAVIAIQSRARTIEAIAFEEGERLLLDGHVRAGVARLRHAGDRTRATYWRLAMTVLPALPWLAPPLMRWRIARQYAA